MQLCSAGICSNASMVVHCFALLSPLFPRNGCLFEVSGLWVSDKKTALRASE